MQEELFAQLFKRIIDNLIMFFNLFDLIILYMLREKR